MSGKIISMILGVLLFPTITSIEDTPVVTQETQIEYDHVTETWLSALEWCESRGNSFAVNPNDLDGTPSYYSFQFKPDTFKNFGEKYSVIKKDLSDTQIQILMKDTKLQRDIVRFMLDDKSVNMHIQFPDCVRKLGLPKK